jgi:hypothetical protein
MTSNLLASTRWFGRTVLYCLAFMVAAGILASAIWLVIKIPGMLEERARLNAQWKATIVEYRVNGRLLRRTYLPGPPPANFTVEWTVKCAHARLLVRDGRNTPALGKMLPGYVDLNRLKRGTRVAFRIMDGKTYLVAEDPRKEGGRTDPILVLLDTAR